MESLYDLTLEDLQSRVVALGEKPYRGRQVWEWAYHHLAASYDDMTNVPATLRQRLSMELPFPSIEIVAELVSNDRLTRKRLLRLDDGNLIEVVLMLYDPRSDSRGRATVCVSSQVGCAMGCGFCATGQAGFERNLTAGEILAQVLGFARELRDEHARAITNVVFMGMGEPMANYGAVIQAARTLIDPSSMNMAARHVTISTVGIIAGIHKLADEPLQIGLAVSLHAPDDVLRQQMIATANRYPLADIIEACRAYIAQTGRRVTFEYCLIDGVNDSRDQAKALGLLLKGILCHVNLIPVNPTPDDSIRRPARTRTIAFQHELAASGVPCTVRVEKGVEISAACGQLRGEAAALELLDARPSR